MLPYVQNILDMSGILGVEFLSGNNFKIDSMSGILKLSDRKSNLQKISMKQ